ncbi:MAG TPA: hypothetical protein VJZ00_08865 [Thermoanaerobaculia bacterium]|nr:hypothetical protein [Thermoanaerobaculia bacterium]
MPEVQLSDYLAYVFSEVSRARDMADRYSKEIALQYEKDDILRHFSVPRFKLSKLDLTMPVLVAGVEVSSLMKFPMSRDEFRAFVISRLTELFTLIFAVRPGTDRAIRTDGLEPLFDDFHAQLVALPDPSKPENVAKEQWTPIVMKTASRNDVASELMKLPPVIELLNRSLLALIEFIKGKIAVPKASIEKLLVNAQTHVVKEGSNDASVFTLKAELVEEGVLVKSVRDERTGVVSKIVDFA